MSETKLNINFIDAKGPKWFKCEDCMNWNETKILCPIHMVQNKKSNIKPSNKKRKKTNNNYIDNNDNNSNDNKIINK